MTASNLAELDAVVAKRSKASAKRPLTAAAAEEILRLEFAAADIDRMNELAERNRRGLLSPAEDAEMEEYIRVGVQIEILQSKARQALKANGQTL